MLVGAAEQKTDDVPVSELLTAAIEFHEQGFKLDAALQSYLRTRELHGFVNTEPIDINLLKAMCSSDKEGRELLQTHFGTSWVAHVCDVEDDLQDTARLDIAVSAIRALAQKPTADRRSVGEVLTFLVGCSFMPELSSAALKDLIVLLKCEDPHIDLDALLELKTGLKAKAADHFIKAFVNLPLGIELTKILNSRVTAGRKQSKASSKLKAILDVFPASIEVDTYIKECVQMKRSTVSVLTSLDKDDVPPEAFLQEFVKRFHEATTNVAAAYAEELSDRRPSELINQHININILTLIY